MKKVISKFSVHVTAKMFALIYGVFGVFAGTIFFLLTLSESVGGAVAMLILMPVVYGGMGYLGTAFFCWLYNFVAGKFNTGITFELKDAE